MLRDRIARYGVELEGAWDYVPENYVHDGSVDIYESYEFIGEIPSPPMTLLSTVDKWITNNYPVFVNESCGMHVHMSFKNLADYALLMDTQTFQIFLLEELDHWGRKYGLPRHHALFSRLQGDNEFCELSFCPDEQVMLTNKGHERYNVLNFCFSLHKTLEVRVLPAFEHSHEAISAVHEVSRIVNSWLKQKRVRKLPKIVEKLIMGKRYAAKHETRINPVRISPIVHTDIVRGYDSTSQTIEIGPDAPRDSFANTNRGCDCIDCLNRNRREN